MSILSQPLQPKNLDTDDSLKSSTEQALERARVIESISIYSLRKDKDRESLINPGEDIAIEITNPRIDQLYKTENKEKHQNVIDGQHGDYASQNKAAVELALEFPIQNIIQGSRLLLEKLDLDAVCAAAILEIRKQNIEINDEVLARINLIAAVDKSISTLWEPKEKITKEQAVKKRMDSSFSGLAQALSEREIDLDKKIKMAMHWLITGEDFKGYKAKSVVEVSKRFEVDSNDNLEQHISSNGNYCKLVDSDIPVSSLYKIRPVVLLDNGSFNKAKSGGNPEIIRRAAIFTVSNGYVDFAKARKLLNEKERNAGSQVVWGGGDYAAIGDGSVLSLETIQEVLDECILYNYQQPNIDITLNKNTKTAIAKLESFDVPEIINEKVQENLKDQGFSLKPEFHLTVIPFNSEIKKLIEDGLLSENEVNEMLDSLKNTPILTRKKDIYSIEKTYGAIQSEYQFTANQKRNSIVVLCEWPALRNFYANLAVRFPERNFSQPFPHITMYVKGERLPNSTSSDFSVGDNVDPNKSLLDGIAIPSQKVFESLSKKIIS